MISYNNSAPNAVNNVGQFGATEGSIGAYKSAAEYAADSKYWAMLSQKNYNSIGEILKEVERLYAEGSLLKEDIEQLKSDFENQNQILFGLIQQTVEAIDNTNIAIGEADAATDRANQAVQDVLTQLDKISNMSVVATTLPPGASATGSFDSSTGVFSFGIPEGQPGKDGTNGTISDIGDVAISTPVSDDYGFFVDKDNGGLYRTPMSEIAKLVPAVVSFNGRTGPVVPAAGDYTVSQVTGAAASGVNNDINQIRGLTTALSVAQGGTGAKNADDARNNLSAMFDSKTSLSGTTNLNDINGLKAGFYHQVFSANAKPELNYPIQIAGSLLVQKTGAGAIEGCIQTYYIFNNMEIIYRRAYTGQGWSEWKKSVLTERLIETSGYTDVLDPNRTYRLRIESNGQWGASDGSVWVPLGLSRGGTGATTVTGVRENLGINRVIQGGSYSDFLTANGSNRLRIQDSGTWGSSTGTGWVPLGVGQGGTGAVTADIARTNLGLGLVATESIVPVTKGGTGATSPENARLSLVSAKSGDNSDITSLTGLTTALSVNQGGTGAKTAEGARASLSAAKTGDNSDINKLSGLTSISGMSPNLELRGVNSEEGHGNGVIYESSDPVEASFGIANIGGGSAVFHNYAKPADGSGIENGVLIGGYGSRPWTGTAYTPHSNVSQHFLMDGKSSATNHGGWFRLLTTPLNKTDADRRQTFATSNNGDLYIGYDVPMGLYKLDVASYNGLDVLNGRGLKQINNTNNEIVLITPRNGATANINFRGVAFNGSMDGTKGATQQGDNMWLSFAGHSGVNFTGAAAGIRIQASSGWSTTNLQCGITIATTEQGSTTRKDRWNFTSDGSLSPASDNAYPIGSSGSRVTSIFATNGTIQTSDARMKTEVRAMTSQELSAAKEIAKEVGFFKWLERVETEGEMARWHAGITVQRVIEIMEKNGLDAVKYGIVCHDIWDESVNISADPDDESKIVETIIPAGDRYSLRYSELNVFIARGLEQRISELEEKLSQ